jgi:hypothetical protein
MCDEAEEQKDKPGATPHGDERQLLRPHGRRPILINSKIYKILGEHRTVGVDSLFTHRKTWVHDL